MDLHNFIKQTLVSIKKGIAEANGELGFKDKERGHYAIYSRNDGEVVFDVAVTASAASKKNKEGSLKVAVLEVGAGKDDASSHETVSRIKFTVKVDSTIR